jgi:hypothetical protein
MRKFIARLTEELDDGNHVFVANFVELDGILLSANNFAELENISRDYLSEAQDMDEGTFEVEFVPEESPVI